MRFTLFCFAALSLFVSEIAQATESTLRLFPDEEPSKVKLPFAYKHLSEEDRKDLKFIPERFYTVLNDDSPTQALVGPLAPCIFVGLRNTENGTTIVFHKHFSNNVQTMVEIAKKELKVQDSKNLQGILFTNNFVNYEAPTQGYFGITTFKALHHGKTQIEELKFIKDALVEGFQIADRSQIKAQKYTSSFKDFELGEYELAEQSVLVDAKLNMHSICAMHEGFPEDFRHLPFQARLATTMKSIQERTQDLLTKHFEGKVTPEALNTYNSIPFEKL